MKKLLLSTIVASTLVSTINADFLGAEAGYAYWGPKLTGDIRKGTQSLDFEKDLGFGSNEANSFMWVYVDHPVPLLPNVKIQKTTYTDSSKGTISKTLTFAGKNLTLNDSATSEFTLDQVDLIAYWRILDNWVNFDIGFNIKVIDGNIKIDTTTKHINEKFDLAIPMLYAKARFDMPFSGLSIEVDGSYMGYDGNKLSDIKAGIVYQSTLGFGATLGLRQESLTLDNVDSTYGDITIQGIYAGLFYHF